MSDVIKDLREASAGETAAAALTRYAKVLEALNGSPMATYHAIHRMGPDTAATIAAFEQKADFPLPHDLTAFYLAHGGVDVGQGWGSVRLFGAAQLLADTDDATPARHPPRHGLLDFIQHAWGGRPEFEEAFSPTQIERLNRGYLVIGMTLVDDNTHRYLYVDRAGRCGALLFNQDYVEEEHVDDLLRMLDASPATLDFNAAFAAEVQVGIKRLAERYF